MKKMSLNLAPLLTLAKKIMAHSRIIAFMLAMLTLIYCVYNIQQIFDTPTDQAYRDEQLKKNTKTKFDQKTIDLIKQLRTTNDKAITLPDGRINPFKE